jgi:hypothetical protein
MDQNGLLNLISANPLVNRSPDEIRMTVQALTEMGIRRIQRHAPWYWRKSVSSFTLSADTATKDLKAVFDDLSKVRFMWTRYGKLDMWSEEKYRNEYPNGMSGSGDCAPSIYVPLNNLTFLFAPTPSADTTIYISYYYIPPEFTLDYFPEQYHDVLVHYILSYFETVPGQPTDRHYWRLFERDLALMVEDAKQSAEQDIDIQMPEMISLIGDAGLANQSR